MERNYERVVEPASSHNGVSVMKKSLLVAAASLFVIGQVFAQGQTPPPSGQNQNQKATQQQNQQGQQTQQTQSKQNAAEQKVQTAKKNKTAKAARGERRHAKSSKRGSHRMAHKTRHHRMARSAHQNQLQTTGFGGPHPQMQMQSGRFPTKLTCKKGQKPDGITCM
jgi:hypothetical protein